MGPGHAPVLGHSRASEQVLLNIQGKFLDNFSSSKKDLVTYLAEVYGRKMHCVNSLHTVIINWPQMSSFLTFKLNID